jgi:multidrug resistance protein
MFAPGASSLIEEFHITNATVATLTVSLYILGFAIGPLILAPLSELYGRLPVYHVSSVIFLSLTIACAVSTNVGMFLAFRFLAGSAGAAPITLGGGTIADVIRPEKRGAAMALWSIGPLLGPVIGPIAGGFCAQAKGWRWTFWVLVILVSLLFHHCPGCNTECSFNLPCHFIRAGLFR